MKLSQSNFNLRSPDCYLVRSYLIATVRENYKSRTCQEHVVYTNCLDVVTLKYRPQKSIKLHNFWMKMSEIT